MTDDRVSGLALIAGSAGMIITMSLHPTGHDFFVPGQLEQASHLGVVAHAVGLFSMPILFLGALGLSRRLVSTDRLSVAALVMYAFAVLAVMNAAVFSGLVAPSLARNILDSEPSSAEAWRVAFQYNGGLNQAFALVFVMASSLAILLWSVSILRSGALAGGVGVYGCVLGPLTMIAVLSGHLRLNVHGFGLIMVGQSVWFVIVGVMLCRIRNV